MGTTTGQRWCDACGQQVMVTARTPNHVLHLLLTVLTAGLWLIVWICAGLASKKWRCTKCGAVCKRRKSYVAAGIVGALLAVIMALPANAEISTWTDAGGVRHYSNRGTVTGARIISEAPFDAAEHAARLARDMEQQRLYDQDRAVRVRAQIAAQQAARPTVIIVNRTISTTVTAAAPRRHYITSTPLDRTYMRRLGWHKYGRYYR